MFANPRNCVSIFSIFHPESMNRGNFFRVKRIRRRTACGYTFMECYDHWIGGKTTLLNGMRPRDIGRIQLSTGPWSVCTPAFNFIRDPHNPFLAFWEGGGPLRQYFFSLYKTHGPLQFIVCFIVFNLIFSFNCFGRPPLGRGHVPHVMTFFVK